MSPIQAEAGFFSSILGGEAYARADSADLIPKDIQQSSQTIALLQANVSSASVFQNKKDTSKKDQVDEKIYIDIVSDNALSAATGPMGILGRQDVIDSSFLETSVYVVRKGDTLSQIAEMFNVSVNTILWANDMRKEDKLVVGDVLFILPISGIEHTITKGQTLQGVAKLYKADLNDILQYNNIAKDAKLAVGDKFFVPNAQKSEEGDKPVKNLSASIAKDQKYYESHPLKNIVGYFINPVPGYRKSQGIHDKNAIDMAIPTGTPIHASAAGRVILARKGYNGGFGNLVIIAHPNGTETLYAHQSKIATTTGAQVSQGEVIGYIGSTGRSTGPHLHFEVHGARNPGVDGSWAN